MNSKDALKRKVDELKKQAEEIEELGVKLLIGTDIEKHNPLNYLKKPNYGTTLRTIQHEAIIMYQQWYSTIFKMINEYIPEWTSRFVSYYNSNTHGYNGVMDYLKLNRFTDKNNVEDILTDFTSDLEGQLSILLSIPSVVEVKEMSLRLLITADVARTEIDQAEILLDSGYERAAGSIAGVALELHLKTMCDVNDVSYPPKATIEPLAQALYKESKLDITEFKRIQYLASIRNKCSHPEPVSAKEVQSLIDEVKRLI